MKIICIGRNYVAHIEELNNERPEEPMVFIKPSTALNTGGFMQIPEFTENMHYELELVLRISRTAKNVDSSNAKDYFDAIGLGIDFTARDIQDKCKAKGHPWEKAKAFDKSAAISPMLPVEKFDLSNIGFRLQKNGATVQEGHSSLMIFDFGTLLSHCSEYFSLIPGDLIFTGTPAGVGPVQKGDILEAYLEDQLLHKVIIN